MKVKIIAHFSDTDGNFAHADLTKPLFADVREQIAQQWVNNGWAIIIPEPKRKEPPPAEEEKPKEAEAKVERAVIETPEDRMPQHEEATVKRKKK